MADEDIFKCACMLNGHEWHGILPCKRGWGINEEVPCSCHGVLSSPRS